MVARLHIMNVGSDLFDDPGSFMSEDGRCRRGVEPVDVMKVGMTHPDRRGSYKNLARTRIVDLHLLYGQRCMRFAEQSGFHENSPADFVTRSGQGACLAGPRQDLPCRDDFQLWLVSSELAWSRIWRAMISF